MEIVMLEDSEFLRENFTLKILKNDSQIGFNVGKGTF